MKKVLNPKIYIVLITAIICISVTAYATTQLAASNITYNNSTLDIALDDLYTKANAGDAVASDIKFGKKALSNGVLITGTYKLPTLDMVFQVGSHGAAETLHQTRINLAQFQYIYSKFKITLAKCETSGRCSTIYFNSTYDQTSGNMDLNTQYLTKDYGNFTVYTTGTKGYFYSIIIQLYN